MSVAPRDENRIATLLGTSNADGTTPITIYADPTTHRLLVDTPGNTVYSETPSGTINGSNVTFTTAHTITTVYSFAINGMYIHPTVDYTKSGSTITFTSAPAADLSGTGFTIVYS